MAKTKTNKIINNRIEKLLPRIRRISFTVQSEGLDPEDLEQEISLSIIRRARAEKSFIQQTDSYILQHGKLSGAAHAARADNRSYSAHVVHDAPSSFNEDEAESLVENLPSASLNPEEYVIQKQGVEEVLSALGELETPDSKSMIIMAFLGYSQKEIAAKLGVTPAAVTLRKQTIRKSLGGKIAKEA